MPSGGAYHLSATLLPGGTGPIDFWVRDGCITFVPVPGAEPLGPRGGFALPGLADCHTHLTLDPSRSGLAAGSAELVESNLRGHARAGELVLRDAGGVTLAAIAFQGRATYPRLQAAGRFIAPEGGYLPTAEWHPAAELAQTARAHAGAGARWVKVIADWPTREGIRLNYDVETLRVLVGAAHGAGARVLAHIAGPEGAHAAVAAGIDSIEHGDGMDDADLVALAARRGAWTPTIAMYPGMIRASVSRPESAERLIGRRDEWLRWAVPRAAALGVTVLAGTDTLPAGSVWREVEALVDYGLAPAEALAAASTGARAWLGEPDGLAEGAAADIVLYASDPRSNPEVLGNPEVVMLGGAVVR